MKSFLKGGSQKFLEGFGFNVALSKFCSKRYKLKNAISFVGGFPIVMKLVSKKGVNEKKQRKIVKNISTYSGALKAFTSLRKSKSSLGVIVQKQVNFSDEFVLGIKKTSDFGNVLFFGNQEKKVSFRVCSVDRKEARRMIKEVVGKEYSSKRILLLSKILLKVCEVGENYSDIFELNINSLVFKSNSFVILDFNLVFS